MVELPNEARRLMNVYIDNCIVNNILDIGDQRSDKTWEENKKYIELLVEGPVAAGEITFFFNPTVIAQIEATNDLKRKEALLKTARVFQFTDFNKTIFPFSFPATFITAEESENLDHLCGKSPSLTKDRKILADSAFNKSIDVLLTTDGDLCKQVPEIDKTKVMLPKALWEYWRSQKTSP